MPENLRENDPGVDIGKVVAKIQEEVNRARRNGSDVQGPETTTAMDGSNIIFQPSRIRSIIAQAEANSDAGAEVTPMLEFSGVTRKFALIAGKIVVYLASFITAKQRVFNVEAIRSLRAVTDSLEELDHGNKSSQAREKQLKQELDALTKEFETLKREHEALKQAVMSMNKS